ncbi:MAG: hypothetical protein ACRDY5_00990 [Acidimicrobiales bacterium]
MPGIDDPEVQLLASIAGALRGDYVTGGADPWLGSPFEWIKKTPSSRRRGKIGEQLVAGWSAAKGLDVIASPDSEADRIIHGYRIEVKFSTMWETGIYRFQQVRDQNYDYAFCLGVAPFDAHAWRCRRRGHGLVRCPAWSAVAVARRLRGRPGRRVDDADSPGPRPALTTAVPRQRR